jgi:tetratricopeptide (TPR) repeat protein
MNIAYMHFENDLNRCFILFIQDNDLEKALDAFTRAVQIDPENGEAWNNIACLYVSPSIFIHSLPCCSGEGLRCSVLRI